MKVKSVNQRELLVTGGAGYIGSHVCVELVQAGYSPVVVDNFSNSDPAVFQRLHKITGETIPYHTVDIRDNEALKKVFSCHRFAAVMHFAGLKAVAESVVKPLLYYANNVAGTLVLCNLMQEFGVNQIVFSSSATVYGDPHTLPIKEDFPVGNVTNPYGRSKLVAENMLRDLCIADDAFRVALLRYFNPVGAHSSGLIGEKPAGIPNNLMPYIAQVASGQRPYLNVYGDDYPTHDGTGVRDYIHVVDLAKGHVAALEYLNHGSGILTANLGTGQGLSVLDMVNAFARVSGRKIPYRIEPRRPGDIASCYADPAYAEQLLHWRASRGIDAMCEDTWRWQCVGA